MFLIRGIRTTFTWDTSHPTFTTANSSCSFSYLAVESFEQQSVFLVPSHFSLVHVGINKYIYFQGENSVGVRTLENALFSKGRQSLTEKENEIQ